MPKPTDTKLREASAELLIFKPAPIDLPAGDDMMFTFEDLVAQDPRFKKLAFGVMDYKETPPKTFLHRPDEVWNCGSMMKVAIAAGVFALRRDVQALRTKGVITTLAEADDIMRYVWSVADKDVPIQNIGQRNSYPLPSQMLEISGKELLIKGQKDAEDFDELEAWHKGSIAGDAINPAKLQQATFWQRMILMLKASDNRAARAVQGALGIRYNVHVMEGLGLSGRSGNSFGGLRPAASFGSKPRYRELGTLRQPAEYGGGRAKGRIGPAGNVGDVPYGATPRACAALLNAIVGNRFIDADSSRQFDHLLREERVISVPSWAVDAIRENHPTIQAWTKVGVWKNIAEFNRIETSDGKLNYGFVILGLGQTDDGVEKAEALAKEIHHQMELIHA
jgi:hypothetical protein